MDFNLNSDAINPFLYDDIDKFIQEIDLSISQGEYEVFGQVSLNDKNIDSLLFKNASSEGDIKQFVQEKINNCYLSRFFKTNVDVFFMEGTKRDMCVIDTSIYDRDTNKQRKITLLYK